jgi:RNA polymerase sigma-70 factor, ECF subfamily
VLLMRDVLGLTVAVVAEQLGTTREAVSSAHQRARATLEQHLRHGGSAPPTLTRAQQRLLERYVATWESGDLDDFVALLADEVVLSMPPMAEWFAGRAAVHGFFAWAWGPAGPGPFRLLATAAKTQPAFGLYGRAADGNFFTPQTIQVLTLHGDRIARLHGFVRPDLFAVFGLPPRVV